LLLLSLVLIELGFLFLSEIFGLVIGYFYGLNLQQLFDLIQNPTDDARSRTILLTYQAATATGLFVLGPLVFYVFIVKGRLAQFFQTKPVSWRPVLLATGSVFSFIVVNSLFVKINAEIPLERWAPDFARWADGLEARAEEITEIPTQFHSPGYFVAAFLVVVVITAFGEELLFRGILQNLMWKITNNAHVAIWITAVLFSALHFQFYGFLPRMMLGLVFGYLYLWSGNLWIPIIGHFINNGLTLVILYLAQQSIIDYDIESKDSFPLGYITIFAALFIYLTWQFRSYFAKTTVDGQMEERI
jgi:membrane protease YdiL (CAAX protease family)